ncbi:MAG: hypothetical protein OXH90_08960 [Paracoccaceae bacterium]|nr:hypothetical protein [Paracoccaceae bacterium]MDE2918191.1 hypothetical protein [Paracoccaceae bacterium]
MPCNTFLVRNTRPPFSTVRNYFHAWSKCGVPTRMLQRLQDIALKEPDISVDLEIVRKAKEGKDFEVLPRRWVVE